MLSTPSTHSPRWVLDILEPSPLFVLAHRVFSDLLAASDADVALMKQKLLSYDFYGREDLWEDLKSPVLGPLKLCEALRLESTKVIFGVNTSGIPGADFWLTVERNGRVAFSDGMDDNDVELYPRYSDC